MRVVLWSLLLLGLVGCGPLDESHRGEPVGALQQAGRDLQGRDLQGRDLQGPSFRRHEARLSTLSRPGYTFVRRALVQARISAVVPSGADDPLVVEGATLTRSDGGQLRILRVQRHRDRSGVLQAGQYEYQVEHLADDGTWKPLCPGEPRGNWAVPTAGYWNPEGFHFRGGTEPFTFSCLESAITKCLDWGYQPWLGSPRPADAPLNLADYHQACTRMARADYCGDGRSFTITGTEINMFDRLYVYGHPGQRQAPTEPRLPFEGAWASAQDRGALCLSKLRWQTLAPGGPCPVRLPDPRDPRNSQDPRAVYCEDRPISTWAGANGLLFNESRFVDRGLYTWAGAIAGGVTDHFTTTSGDYDPRRGTTPPRPGYALVRFEGAVLSPLLAAPAGTRPLYRLRGPASEHLTTTTGPPAGYVRVALEGHVYTVFVTGRVPLRLYQRGSDYLTTTGPPPSGYALVGTEGYLPR